MKILLYILLVCVGANAQSRILFERWNPDSSVDIWLMNANGLYQRKVTTGVSHNLTPRISPDGKFFAFGSDRDSIGDGTLYQIYVSDFIGLTTRRLTTTPFVVDHAPDWSPDGTKIVFGRCNFVLTICDIGIVNLDGTNQQTICSSPQDDDIPRFSPDGSQIIFASNRSGNYEVYKCDLAGGTPQPLAANPAEDGWASWSPDGSKIYFASRRDVASLEVYSMNADGSNVVRLTTNTVNDFWPECSADGQRLVWSRNTASGYKVFEAPVSSPNSAVQLTSNGVNDYTPHYRFVTRKFGRTSPRTQ